MESLASRLRRPERLPRPQAPTPIALAITDLDVGGAERMLTELALRIDRRAYEPTVVCLAGEGDFAAALTGHGVPVVCLNVNRKRPIAAIRALARVFRERRPQLVQSFLFHANVASRLAARLAGTPWVVSGTRVAERRSALHPLVDRITAHLCCGTVCVSEGVREFTRFEGRWPAERLAVIPNGIDVRLYDAIEPIPRSELEVADSAPVALFAGRLEEQKGLVYLLDAALEATERLPEWRLLIAGSGPLETELRDRVRHSEPLRKCLRFLGKRSDLPRVMRTADLLVLPSLWEGMPNVVLEAMALSRGVVATRAEGSRELVLDGETGRLVPLRDPHALAEAIVDLHSNQSLLETYGRNGRARVEAEFGLDRMVRSYESLWAMVLGLEDPRRERSAAVEASVGIAEVGSTPTPSRVDG